jgi:small subunit ribosomal protein S7e
MYFLSSFLDQKDEKEVEGKLDTYSSVYKKLTGKDATFLFPQAK